MIEDIAPNTAASELSERTISDRTNRSTLLSQFFCHLCKGEADAGRSWRKVGIARSGRAALRMFYPVFQSGCVSECTSVCMRYDSVIRCISGLSIRLDVYSYNELSYTLCFSAPALALQREVQRLVASRGRAAKGLRWESFRRLHSPRCVCVLVCCACVSLCVIRTYFSIRKRMPDTARIPSLILTHDILYVCVCVCVCVCGVCGWYECV